MMRTFGPWSAVAIVSLVSAVAQAADAPRPTTMPTLATPAVSPDGTEIAFASADALWTVPAAGGDAHVLVSGIPEIARPLYSPDGNRVAFASARAGRTGIYVVSRQDGALKRLTFDTDVPRLDAWSPDGRSLLYGTGSHQFGTATDVYRVPVDGGTPMPVVAEFYNGASFASPSPDGDRLAFCGSGMASAQWWRHGHAHIDEDSIWLSRLTPAGATNYQRLTSDTEKNVWPMWTHDGTSVVFVSDRDGNENLWSCGVPAGVVSSPPVPKQLTHFQDGRLLWPSLSADGHTVAFERDGAIWTVDLSADTPPRPLDIRLRGTVAGPDVDHQTATHDATDMAVSDDGRKVAVIVHGQLFAAPALGGKTADGSAVRVTHTDAIEDRPTWAHDNRRIAYTSTRDGPRHLYLYDFGDARETRLTNTAGNDSQPLFSPDDSAIAFVRNGSELHTLQLTPLPMRRRQIPPATTVASTRPSTQPGTTQVAATQPATQPAALSPDRLLASALSLGRAPLDGDRVVAWSPAGDMLAYVTPGPKGFRNVYVVLAAGGASHQVSFLANAGSDCVAWSPDATTLYLNSGQRTEDFNAASIDLIHRAPTFRPNPLREMFRDRPNRMPDQPPEGADAPEPIRRMFGNGPAFGSPTTRPTHTTIDFADIDQRLSLLNVGVDVHELAISPDGKTMAVIGASADHENVYVYPVDPLIDRPVARQLTATATGKSNLQFVGDRLYYLDGGRVMSVPARPDSGDSTPRPTDAAADPSAARAMPAPPRETALALEYDVDFGHEKGVVFEQAWRTLGENFHDPKMNGADWPAVRRAWLPRVLGAVTPTELRRSLLLMIGELNASHLGLTPGRDSGDLPNAGRLGVDFDPAEYELSGRLKIAGVVPFGPADVVKLKTGAVLRAVDGQSVDRPANLERMLDARAEREVVLTVEDDTGRHEVRLKTIADAAEKALRYRAWVQANSKYVFNASGGRLGYVHLADMGKPALARLANDLDEQNQMRDGVVVDVRNNSGGFVNGYAIDFFSRRNYMLLEPRDSHNAVTGRAALGQRYLGLPTVLVTNRNTLSDGEDFTEGYRAQHLGPVVGEPTAGWIIFTTATRLLDGSTLRLPMNTVLDTNHAPLEMHPRPVDVEVMRDFGESLAGKDSQLDAAVTTLLKTLP